VILKDMHKAPCTREDSEPGLARAGVPKPAEALHANLQTAVQSENYEQAASLRDQSRIWRCSEE